MGVWRNRMLRTITVPLTEKPGDPSEDQPARPVIARKESEPFGLSVDEQPGVRGLRISAVDPRGSGYRGGLRDGDVVIDVDGRAVGDRASFRRALTESAAVTRLYVRRNGRPLFFALRKDSRAAKVGKR